MPEIDWDNYFEQIALQIKASTRANDKKNIGIRMAIFIMLTFMRDSVIKERAIAVLKEVAKVQ